MRGGRGAELREQWVPASFFFLLCLFSSFLGFLSSLSCSPEQLSSMLLLSFCFSVLRCAYVCMHVYVHVCLYVYVARFGNIFQELLILNNSKVRWTHHKHTHTQAHTPSQADTPQARTNTCTVYLRFSAAGATLLILGRSRKTAKIWRKHLCRDTGTHIHTYIHSFVHTYVCTHKRGRIIKVKSLEILVLFSRCIA